MAHPSLRLLRFRLADSPACPAGRAAPCDLEIELPDYVYFRLGLNRKKDATISIHRSAMHVIPVG